MTVNHHHQATTIISALSTLTHHQLSHLTHTISAHFHHHLRRLTALLSSKTLFSQTLIHLHSITLQQKSLLISKHLLYYLRHLTATFTTTALPPPPMLYSLRLHEQDSVLILLLLCELQQNDPHALRAPQTEWRSLLIKHMLNTMLNMSSLWDVNNGAILIKYVGMVTKCLKLSNQSVNDQSVEVAASRASVVTLPSVTIRGSRLSINNNEALKCVICRDEMSEGRDVCKLPCQHLFHWICILKWVRNRNTCPCCRFRLPSDDVYGEIQRLWGLVVEKGGGWNEENK